MPGNRERRKGIHGEKFGAMEFCAAAQAGGARSRASGGQWVSRPPAVSEAVCAGVGSEPEREPMRQRSRAEVAFESAELDAQQGSDGATVL